MRIAVKNSAKDWHRDGINIRYRQSRLSETLEGLSREKKYYELSFTYDFKQKQDTVYFAYCVPYTFSKMQARLRQIKTKRDIVREDRLCYSLSGLPVPILTVTSHVAKVEGSGAPVEIEANDFRDGSWLDPA
jgi:cytosolic carboxypeptidase protein 2/3